MLEKEDLEKNLDRIHEWIRTADQKTSIYFAFLGVVVSLLLNNLKSWIQTVYFHFSYLERISLIIAIILVALSFVYLTIAVVPRINNSKTKLSTIYFKDIALFNIQDYKKTLQVMNTQNYINELVDQIHSCSQIAVEKYHCFSEAVKAFIGGSLFLFLLYLVDIIFYA